MSMDPRQKATEFTAHMPEGFQRHASRALKAPADRCSPRPDGSSTGPVGREASWTAAVLGRLGGVAKCALFLAPLVFAAEPATAAPVRSGGTLRLAVEADPRSLDAAQVFSNVEATLGFFLFNTLIDAGPEGGFVPVLAESLPTTSADGFTHTFRLRRDVRFSNGQELTADDVVFTFERFFDPGTAAATGSYFYSIAGGREFMEARKQEAAAADKPEHQAAERWIEPLTVSGLRALGRHTVEIRMKQPDLAFLHVLTSAAAGIVSRAEVERLGRRFATQPVGTGRFLGKEWVRGARLRLARNPHHFRADLPCPDAVEVLVNVDRATQAMMFERGELDFQYYLQDPDYHRFRRDPRLQSSLRIVMGTSPTYVFLNCEMPPFTNRLVRLALNHAVDKDALVRVLARRGVPQQGPLPLAVQGFNRGLPAYAHDPARARALLAEAGFPGGFETTLWAVRENPAWMKAAQFVQESLRQIGVVAQIKEVTAPTLLDFAGRRRTVPMGTSDWVSAFDDPKETLDTVLNGNNLTDEGCANLAFYSNPRVQQLFRDADTEANAARRLEIYRDIERQVVEDAPWIFLIQMNLEMMCQPWLKGFTARGFWPPARLENCWLER